MSGLDLPGPVRDSTDRFLSAIGRAPAWAVAVVLASLLGVIWLVVYGSGGSKTALPHLFYIPIILAALRFGPVGALVAAVISAVLCGPFLPADTATGETQAMRGVLIRGVMFLMVGGLAALSISLSRRLSVEDVTSELHNVLSGVPTRILDHSPDVASRVPQVLADQAFHPVFQPIYALDDSRLIAVEALTRFEGQPQLTPDVWFAAARRCGLGPDLELAAVGLAIERSRGLPEDVELCVNVSPAAAVDPRLVGLLTGLAGRNLTIELTEHEVVEDYEALVRGIAPLRAAGVLLAIDDAGAGFASLRHVIQLRPDAVKLDISLTQHLDDSPVRRALGAALVEFVHSTGALLIVEGIERDADLAIWSHLGADAAQGYLLGRPGPLPIRPRSDAVIAMRSTTLLVRQRGLHAPAGPRHVQRVAGGSATTSPR